MSNLNLNIREFNRFLNSLSKINNSAILEVDKDKMYSIINSEDRSLFLWAELGGDFGINESLNLPSLPKLSNALDMIGTPDVIFEVSSNCLQYKGQGLKFKYHLYDDGILTKPKVTLSKIESLTYDYEFELGKGFVKTLLKNSSIFKDTNKLYIYTEDGHLVWSLADKTIPNTDAMTVIGDEVDFEMDEFILNLDNMRLVDFGTENFLTFRINKNGIGSLLLHSDNLTLNYIISSLQK